ncbi:hypothetical protein JR316_0009156 [Psilocybe cubensis]|uniref:F-box domain-containing protein n=2 Tax=Psilocybe cubensis TaxID=181762 RepID=A0A8H7XWU6_PSICU|nr:hypothetical protein JR316_0009156 [Psilocybe cubensis]KAH9478698.1 hypothetical protein JR316_0009156 [Psilocybe cubensis]
MDLLHDSQEDLEGMQVYENCKISDGQPCLSCRRYVEFEKQVVSLKMSFMQQLQKMRDQQRRLRTKINRGHDPLVRVLPSEVMASVFECYVDSQNSVEKSCQQVYNCCAPLILGAVSQSWRRIAWSSPQLWTHISINPRGYEHWTCLEVAQECLSRSGQLPLSIEVSLYHPDLNHQIRNRQGIFRQVIDLVNRYSSRWQDLRVICRSEILPLFTGNAQGTPIIRKLLLEYPFDTYNRVEGDAKFKVEGLKPRPTHVSLSNFGFQSLDIDWLRVTNVQFHKTKITLDQFFQLLQQAPELMDCQLSCISDSERSFRYPMNEIPIVHHALRSLEIGKYQGKELGLFFSFPELTHLTIEHITDPESRVLLNSIVPLIERSSCQLTYLRLHNVLCNRESFIGLLRTTPSLHRLELSICKASLDVLQFLADTSVAQFSGEDACHQNSFLPNLQSIHYSDVRPVWDPAFWALIPTIPGLPSEFHNPQRRPLTKVEFACRQARWSDPKPLSMVCKDQNVVARFIELMKLGISFHLTHANVDMLKNSIIHHGFDIHEAVE